LYRQYKNDPTSVDERWALVFAGYEFASQNGAPPASEGEPALRVADLVDAYRNFGHLIADLDPLGHSPRSHPYLELERFGLGENDFGRTVSSGTFRGLADVPFGKLLEALRETYCGTLGVELVDIRDNEQRDWLEEHMEGCRNRPRTESACTSSSDWSRPRRSSNSWGPSTSAKSASRLRAPRR
jgi:2-oxoglutarate dehydrogenase E1 component